MPLRFDFRALVTLLLAVAGLGIVLAAARGERTIDTLLELSSAAIMFAAFTIGWNARRFTDSGFLAFVGLACLFVAVLDMLHALAMLELGLFPPDGGNLAVRLWMAARALETGAVALAALAAPRRLDGPWAMPAFALVTVALLAVILGLDVFPDAFRQGLEDGPGLEDGRGLTAFRLYGEALFVAVKLASIAVVWTRRAAIGPAVARAMLAYLVLSALSEATFCVYQSLHGGAYIAGHLLEVAGFVILYRAVVACALTTPYEVLFHNLQAANRRLEERVEQRTRLLAEADRALAAAVAERERLEVLERAIFLGADHLIIATGTDGTILDLNPAAERALGYRRDELVGRMSMLAFHDHDEVARRAAELTRALGRPVAGFDVFVAPTEGGRKAQSAWTYVRRDGGRFPVLLTVNRLHDRDGLPIGYVGVAADLTELNALRAQAQEASSRLLDAIDSISDGFVLFDRDDKLVLCNSKFREFFPEIAELMMPGADFEAVLRQGVARGQYDLGGDLPEEWITRRVAEHRNPGAPREQRLTDGRWLLLSDRRTADGGIVSLRTDITAMKLTEGALKEINALNRAMLRAAPLAVLVVDPMGKVILWEGAAERIFGWSASEVLGRPIPTVPDGEREAFRKVIDTVMRGNTLREMEVVRRRKDGRLVDLLLSASPVRDDANRVIGTMGLIADVTERKRTESALLDSEERFRALVSNLPGLVFRRVLRTNGTVRYEYASDAFRSIFGLAPEVLTADADQFERFVHPEDRERVGRALTDSARSLRTVDLEFRALTADGETRWLHSVSQPRQRSTGEVVWDGVAFDLTDRKREQERQRATEKALALAQRMEAVGQLAGGMAHEFNNMLVPIVGLVELTLMQVPDGSRQRRNLQVALEAADRARQLVRRILTFSRYSPQSGGAWPLRRAVLDALRIIRTVTPASITVRDEVAAGELWTACEDGELQQILLNLTSNATHAMMPRGGTLTVTLDEAPADGLPPTLPAGRRYARLVVGDTGTGMDEETRARIFEPFFTTKPVGEGTGIGLAVVHSIVTAHEGDVSVRSAPGDGTVFLIHLPLLTPDAPAAKGERATATAA